MLDGNEHASPEQTETPKTSQLKLVASRAHLLHEVGKFIEDNKKRMLDSYRAIKAAELLPLDMYQNSTQSEREDYLQRSHNAILESIADLKEVGVIAQKVARGEDGFRPTLVESMHVTELNDALERAARTLNEFTKNTSSHPPDVTTVTRATNLLSQVKDFQKEYRETEKDIITQAENNITERAAEKPGWPTELFDARKIDHRRELMKADRDHRNKNSHGHADKLKERNSKENREHRLKMNPNKDNKKYDPAYAANILAEREQAAAASQESQI